MNWNILPHLRIRKELMTTLAEVFFEGEESPSGSKCFYIQLSGKYGKFIFNIRWVTIPIWEILDPPVVTGVGTNNFATSSVSKVDCLQCMNSRHECKLVNIAFIGWIFVCPCEPLEIYQEYSNIVQMSNICRNIGLKEYTANPYSLRITY